MVNTLVAGIAVIIVIAAIIGIAYFAMQGSYPQPSGTVTTGTTAQNSTQTTAPHGNSTSTTNQSNSTHPAFVTFNVTETDSAITPSVFYAYTNESIIFNITNNGSEEHDFGIWSLGQGYGTKPINGMGGFAQFEITFSKPGNFTLTSNLNNDSLSGARATLVVQ